MATDYTQDANCMGAWLFTEGSGTTVADASGEGNTGTFLGSGEPAWSASVPSGYSNNSVDFDGTNDLINCTTVAVASSNISFVAWVNLDGVGGSTENHRVVVSITEGTASQNWNSYFAIGDWDNANTLFQFTDILSTNAEVPITGWQHVAVTYDGSNIRYYLNGALDSTVAFTGSLSTSYTTAYIGGRNNGVDTTYMNGLVTEVGYFTRVLSLSEIGDIMDFGLDGSLDVATTKFRKTLSGIGTGTGKRQMVGN